MSNDAAALLLMMQDKGKNGHYQNKNNGTTNYGVRDVGVVGEMSLRCDIVLPASSFCRAVTTVFITVVLAVVLSITHKASVYTSPIPAVEAFCRAQQRVCCAVFFITSIRTVFKSITPETAYNAMDATCTGKEC